MTRKKPENSASPRRLSKLEDCDNLAPLEGSLTPAEKYGPAMGILDLEEAQQYLELCVRHSMTEYKLSREAALALERENLGYWAGYYDEVTRARVENFYGAVHPVLGSVKNGPLTPEQFFAMGQLWAEKSLKKGNATH